MSEAGTVANRPAAAERQELEEVVVRFAGDSGDGVQLTGGQFTLASALAGNDLATFPDFPAEIRAPAGTTYGVSAYQIHFGARRIRTSGDAPDVLVAFNPAALAVNLGLLRRGGVLIVDADTFTPRNLQKAGWESNPLEDGSLDGLRVIKTPMSSQTLEAVEPFDLSQKEGLRCKNFWALGFVYWLFGRDRGRTVEWLRRKFREAPHLAEANIAALNAGHAYAETAELGLPAFSVPPAPIDPGLYRTVTGSEAMAFGLLAASQLAGLPLFFASYPITPASPILHALARMKEFGVTTFQAEDEIAACCAAIGASFAGAIGVTSSSGPGIALKQEAVGLAVSAELPLVVIDTQRGGPSTGLPTKAEQSDLFQAIWGRNADSPVVVLAPRSPADCFSLAIEAVRIATRYMTPVFVLSDAYIANASEPWRIPDVRALPRQPVTFRTDPEGFHPMLRDPRTLARAWAVPGTPGLEHRIGGLEKDYATGNISYDPANHQRMSETRRAKVLGVAREIPPQGSEQGESSGRLAIVGWGSTYGAIASAVARLREEGHSVCHIHLRHLWPLPPDLGVLLHGFERVLVPELNMGQLVTLLRAEYVLPAEGISKVAGQPFEVREIVEAARLRLEA